MEEPFLQAPQIITNPGSPYTDDTRRFQGIPEIARAEIGRIWACWYGGGVTRPPAFISADWEAGISSWSNMAH